MTHANLHNLVAEQPSAREHFRVNEEAFALGQQLLQGFSAKDFEGAVAVADARVEEKADKRVVAPGEETPLPRVLAVNAVADSNGV
jgi:hypothetical protein